MWKVIRIDEEVPDSMTTSMLDDVFYVLQSCLQRAISTSNISSDRDPLLWCSVVLVVC